MKRRRRSLIVATGAAFVLVGCIMLLYGSEDGTRQDVPEAGDPLAARFAELEARIARLEKLEKRVADLDALIKRFQELENRQPRYMVRPPALAGDQDPVPPDWQEHEINGMKFYIVPLNKSPNGGSTIAPIAPPASPTP